MTLYTVRLERNTHESAYVRIEAPDEDKAMKLGEDFLIEEPGGIFWHLGEPEEDGPCVMEATTEPEPEREGLDALESEDISTAIGYLKTCGDPGYSDDDNAQLDRVITVLSEHLIDRNEG